MSFAALSLICLALGQDVEAAAGEKPDAAAPPALLSADENANPRSSRAPRPLVDPNSEPATRLEPGEQPAEPTPRAAAPAAAIEDDSALVKPPASAPSAAAASSAPAKETAPPAALPSEGFVPRKAPANELRRDPEVQQAGGAKESPAAATPAAETASATLLLSRALTAPQEHALEGGELSLADALGRLASPGQYQAAVKTYWKLACRVGEYHLCLQEAQMLESANNPHHPQERAILNAARAAARSRLSAARLRVAESQHDLAEMLTNDPNRKLPLPVDVPYVGNYRTRFETLFATRTPPPGVRRLHHTLPLQKDLIERQAAAVSTAETAMDELWDLYANSQAPLTLLLTAFDDLRQRRGEFLQGVQTYNEQIADYAMVAVGPSVGREAVVSMLIKPRLATSQPGQGPPEVQPAAASQPLGSRSSAQAADTPPSLNPSGANTASEIRPVKPAPFLLNPM